MIYSLQKILSMFPIPQNGDRLILLLGAESIRFKHYQRKQFRKFLHVYAVIIYVLVYK